jgi:hypothetical protein
VALVALLLAGCGSSAPADQRSSPPGDADVDAQRAVDAIPTPTKRKAAPHDASFRVSYRSVTGKDDDLDLLNAVTDPMIDPLMDATPTQARRRLNARQYRVWALFTIDVDVSDGGVTEIYFNSSGDYATGAVRQLLDLGAPRHASALRMANRVLWPDGHVPRGMGKRRRQGAGLDDPRFDAAVSAWDRADRAEGELDAILARYIRGHLPSFFTP